MWKLNWTELGIDLDRLKEVLTYDAAQPMIFSSGFFLLLFLGFSLVPYLASYSAALAPTSRGRLTLSLNANITFLRAISEGYVYAEATETFNHGRVPFIEVRLVDEQQQLIAVLTSSGYRKSEELNIDELE